MFMNIKYKLQFAFSGLMVFDSLGIALTHLISFILLIFVYIVTIFEINVFYNAYSLIRRKKYVY